MLEITEQQCKKVKKLVRKECANFFEESCLLLDDGEKHGCVQLLTDYEISCGYFEKSVLPAHKKLCSEINKRN